MFTWGQLPGGGGIWALQRGEDFSGWEEGFQAGEAEVANVPELRICPELGSRPVKATAVEEVARAGLSQVWRLVRGIRVKVTGLTGCSLGWSDEGIDLEALLSWVFSRGWEDRLPKRRIWCVAHTGSNALERARGQAWPR
ncbi:unnamed protein product [Gulo gulo]|uniref:Uncharacterized protein n=1 Tax=Gulo gulo TaxID=48420 RepID=A0A9X9PYS4_GULGU|nr:unnamed protein product [Gulo gulo]